MPVNALARIGLALVLALPLAGVGVALGQQSQRPQSPQGMPLPEEDKTTSSAAQKFRALTEPEALEKLEKKKESKPPFEFFRSQIAPFDVLPFVKPGHWNTLTLEMRANYGDYAGLLQSAPVKLAEMPHAVVYRRDARLQKEQDARLSQQVMLPEPRKEMLLELTRPDAIRADGAWQASLLRLEPHQMLIPVLHPEPSAYAPWSRINALVPSSGDKDTSALEKQRYYRLVLPQTPDKPVLSPHPLTWTTISHLVWDGVGPEVLNVAQQRALVDWLHWGGQLIVVGVGPTVAALQDSFLAPYLPATPTGAVASLGEADLEPMANLYPEVLWPTEWEEQVDFNTRGQRPPRYKGFKPIRPAPRKPVLFATLAPKPGSMVLPLDPDEPGGRLLGVEWRVGRGRVTMLSFNPIDPAFSPEAWPGMDSFVRRVILRRPEERELGQNQANKAWTFLAGPELSWVRFLGRDLNVPVTSSTPEAGDLALPTTPVAAWVDTAGDGLPARVRRALEDASGISIPHSSFVLRVILAYIIALVPVNYLACRFLLRRREWAWALVPVLALGFAVWVERAAAYDLGYDSACDEIDLLEVQGGYPQGHLNRFAALYSTGRDRYTIAYPDDPTALALPLNMGPENYQRGQDVAQSVFQSSPDPALVDFQVQPRSLAMFRAEAMVGLGGTIRLLDRDDKAPRRVVNATSFELRDAELVDVDNSSRIPLGTIAPGSTVAVDESRVHGPPPKPKDGEAAPKDAAKAQPRPQPRARGKDGPFLDVEPFLEPLRAYRFGREEDKGEVRLVAWTPGPHPGQVMEPKVDRHRGFRLVVAHLRYGPPPDPGGVEYYRPHRDSKGTTTQFPAPAVAATAAPAAAAPSPPREKDRP